MKEFTDIAALQRVTTRVIADWSREQRRALFEEFLTSELEFTAAQAALYVSVVLAENSEGSADAV